MPQEVPEAAKDHYRRMQRLQVLALGAGAAAWSSVDPDRIVESWSAAMVDLEPVVSRTQRKAAEAGALYGAETLVQSSGEYRPPEGFVNPAAFAGVSSSGAPLDLPLMSPAFVALSRISDGLGVVQALRSGKAQLDGVLATQVADAGRMSSGVDVASRAGVGYVRMLNPPSCERCVVLAGRRYRWNQGFLRHPHCDCVHVQATVGALRGAEDEGLLVDQYEYFDSLSEAEQNRIFGGANAAAIRDGADMNQVINARRGMTPNGTFTTEGTSRRGNASRLLKPRQRRMTPESIYAQAGSRQEAMDLLRHHGYILPQGQVAGGSLRGWDYEGFGQLGRGGTRRAASQAVLDARATGTRDPNNRYTMTAAERRLYDARRRYEVALSGTSPYTSPGFGKTPDPYGLSVGRGPSPRPVTPAELARAEKEYRAYLYSGGEIFTE